MRFEDKRAMVTGGGHGIGRAIAERLAGEGARVLICDRDRARAEDVAAELGEGAKAYVLDVRERAEVDAAVAEIVNLWGGLDVLVANAGVMDRMPFLETTDEHWRTVLGINLYGAFLCGQVAARQMVAQGTGGRIVNVASNSGIFGGRGRAAYGASKAALINLTQSMAIELAEYDILVNAVAPGPTRTRPEIQGDLMESAARRMPLKRFGEPAEIAAVAAFLASDDCSFTTGHVYAADGGFTIAGIMEG
ncbi:MAG: SDR family oxidoreductase [Alphaproteobacteria bacterium]|jgi:NAD(P)-dependent dehydrogenase (short-subunit alcohol dehydrogenase family)|nr:SDR family oxidoreductase [Alphaproteobacteria bacterium]